MKEVDDTPVPESESDGSLGVVFYKLKVRILNLEEQVTRLQVEVADLHHRRRVSRQQAVDQDPEWF